MGKKAGIAESMKAVETGNPYQSPREPAWRQPQWRQLGWLAAVEFLAMSLWFTASAVVPQLSSAWRLSSGAQAWLTMSVQLGFVIGALLSAGLNLPDRFPPHRLLALCAAAGGIFNALIALFVSDSWGQTAGGFAALVTLRILTGISLAGVYPPGMKLMATWFLRGRGLAIGVLVGALTVGSASPHLLLALPVEQSLSAVSQGIAGWRLMLLAASALAITASALGLFFVRPGPHLPSANQFDWRYAARIWGNEAVRRANFGYLGHMWELYAMWAWAPLFLLESYQRAGFSVQSGRLVAYAMVAIGGLGSIAAGALADRLGRTRITIVSLAISGSCALVAGFLFEHPLTLTILCLVWGAAIVADSAQFSTAVSELCEPGFVGTALTIQTCAGFLLTMATIRGVSLLKDAAGWPCAFAVLALGPMFGIWHMAKLRRMPAAVKMASGRR